MAEIVNLRRARKARSRQQAEVTAGENRLVFGRSKAARLSAQAQADLTERRHEGHRLSAPSDKPSGRTDS